MKSIVYKGWCVFGRSSRTEWHMPYTVRGLRREAIEAWFQEMVGYGLSRERAWDVWQERIADGSLRLGKCEIRAALTEGEER